MYPFSSWEKCNRCTPLYIGTISLQAPFPKKYGFHMCYRKHKEDHKGMREPLQTIFQRLFYGYVAKIIFLANHFLLCRELQQLLLLIWCSRKKMLRVEKRLTDLHAIMCVRLHGSIYEQSPIHVLFFFHKCRCSSLCLIFEMLFSRS